MRAGRTLRQLVMDRIIDQVPDLAGRVYDRATEDTPYPYASMGPSYRTDASVECVAAEEWTLQVDIWHSKSSKGVLEDIVDDVKAALKGWTDHTRLNSHPFSIGLMRVMDDPDGVSSHGVIQIEALIEAEQT